MRKKNIVVIFGGNSSEFSISVESRKNIVNIINKELFNVYTVQIKGKKWTVINQEEEIYIDKNDFGFIIDNEKIKVDCVLNMIHGTPGEDGLLQAYFDLLEIPYTTGGVLNSALTANKYFCNKFLSAFGVKTAKSRLLKKNDYENKNYIKKEFKLPFFVKPNTGGSSCATSKVKETEKLDDALNEAFGESKEVIVEEFIAGKEVSCGVLITDKYTKVLPITEIRTKNDFFNYEAKYDNNKTEEITPAPIGDELTERIQKLAAKIVTELNCKGIVRIDFIINNEEIYFLEVNTIPGMSLNSIIPKQLKAANINITDIYTEIINEAVMTKSKLC